MENLPLSTTTSSASLPSKAEGVENAQYQVQTVTVDMALAWVQQHLDNRLKLKEDQLSQWAENGTSLPLITMPIPFYTSAACNMSLILALDMSMSVLGYLLSVI